MVLIIYDEFKHKWSLFFWENLEKSFQLAHLISKKSFFSEKFLFKEFLILKMNKNLFMKL